MTVKELNHKFHEVLDNTYGRHEVDSIFYLSIEHYLKLSRVQVALTPQRTLTPLEIDMLSHVLLALQQQQPIQYILGNTEFYGLSFHVNPSVLIPRPETEELVDWIISKNNTKTPELRILDIGTGSGCIAISLAKHLPNAKVYAMDISATALQTAKTNAQRNAVSLTFIDADILHLDLNNFDATYDNFDIIVSNPPYVRQQEKKDMQPHVLNHEPHVALFVSDNAPLVFYDAITRVALKKLKPKGQLYFEINQYLGAEMKHLLSTYNFSDIELRKDLNNNDRFLNAIKY